MDEKLSTFIGSSTKSYYLSGILIIIGVIILVILNFLTRPLTYNILLPCNEDMRLIRGQYGLFYQNDGATKIDSPKIHISLVDKSTKNKVNLKNNNQAYSQGLESDSVLYVDGPDTVASESIALFNDNAYKQLYKFEIVNSGIYEVSAQYKEAGVKVYMLVVEQKNLNSPIYPFCSVVAILLMLFGVLILFIAALMRRRCR